MNNTDLCNNISIASLSRKTKNINGGESNNSSAFLFLLSINMQNDREAHMNCPVILFRLISDCSDLIREYHFSSYQSLLKMLANLVFLLLEPLKPPRESYLLLILT